MGPAAFPWSLKRGDCQKNSSKKAGARFTSAPKASKLVLSKKQTSKSSQRAARGQIDRIFVFATGENEDVQQ